MTMYLEIVTYGMAAETAEGQTLAETREEIVSWDVALLLRNDVTGDIEVLEELDGLTDTEAFAYQLDLERRYPDACVDDAVPY